MKLRLIVICFMLTFIPGCALAATDSDTTVLKAYQDVAFVNPQPNSVSTGTSGARLDWASSPSVFVTGAPTPQDVSNVKSFVSILDSSCSQIAPAYVTQTLSQVNTTRTVSTRRSTQTYTSTTNTPSVASNYISLNFSPSTSFNEALPTTQSLSHSYTQYSYNSSQQLAFFGTSLVDEDNNFINIQDVFSTTAESQTTRNLLVDKALLKALGLNGETSQTGASAFGANANWDGTMSTLDREILEMQCSTEVPSLHSADAAIQLVSKNSTTSAISQKSPELCTPSVTITNSGVQANIIVRCQFSNLASQSKSLEISYSLNDSSGNMLDSGLLTTKSAIIPGLWVVKENYLPVGRLYFSAIAEDSNTSQTGSSATSNFMVWGQ